MADDCGVCHRDMTEHYKKLNGEHPPDWYAAQLAKIELENTKLRNEMLAMTIERENLMANHGRKFGPKKADHPSIGDLCPGCKKPFKEGDYTTLIGIGPGADAEEQAKASAGKAYTSVAIEAHWICVTGSPT